MIPLLPKWHLHGNRPTFYDTDAVTMLELASTLHGSMNTLIDDYNKFVDNVNETISELMKATEQDQEVFKTAIRQEFQDFIDIVNLKVAKMENDLEFTIKNMNAITEEIVNEAIREGKIKVVESYDENTKSLNLNISGGV